MLSLRSIISSSSNPNHYYARGALYLSALFVVAMSSAIMAVPMIIIGRRFDIDWVVAKTFHAVASTLLDLEVEVEGEEIVDNNTPAVMMFNHQSMVDIVILGRLTPKRSTIMAKHSLQFTPLGPFMLLAGAIFINRGNNAKAVQSLSDAALRIKTKKLSISMYPEGTRHLSERPDILPLKKGGFHLAIQSGLPIIPIVTENYWKLYRPGYFSTGTIKVRVLPAIPTAGMTVADVPRLANLVRDQMLAALLDLASPDQKAAAKSSEKSQELPQTEESGVGEGKAKAKDHVADEPPVAVDDVVVGATVGATVGTAVGAAVGTGVGATVGATVVAAVGAAVDAAVHKVEKGKATGGSRGSSGSSGTSSTEEDEGMILVGRPTN